MAKEDSDDLSLDLDANPAPGAAPASTPGKKKKIIIVATACLLILIIGGLAVGLVLKKNKAKSKLAGKTKISKVKEIAKTEDDDAKEPKESSHNSEEKSDNEASHAEPEVNKEEAKEEAKEEPKEEAHGEEEPSAEEGKEGEGEKKKSALKVTFYSIKPAFVVNFVTEGRGPKYLQVQVVLKTKSSSVVNILDAYLPLIKNELVELFSSKKYDELNNPVGKEILRKEALLRIQKTLETETGKPQIESVLFESFVMQ